MATVKELAMSITFKDKATKEIKKANNEMEKSKGIFSKMNDGIKKIDKNVQKMGKKMQKTGKKISGVGSKMTKKLTVPITAAATVGVKGAMDIEKGIKKVATLADADILPEKAIKEQARRISDSSGVAYAEVLESMYGALSAGIDSKDVVKFTESGVDLMRAGFTDMPTVIDATTTALNAYGDAAYDTTKIHDIMVKTQDKGKIEVGELGSQMGRVIPTASTLGVNMDQLGASYAILTAKGQPAAIATTNLNSMLGEMAASGGKVDKVLKKKTGKSFQQLSKEGKNVGEVLAIIDEEAKSSGKMLGDYFGKNAKAAADTLMSDGVGAYTEMVKEMQNSDGITKKNADSLMTSSEKVKKAFNKVKNSLYDLGELLIPYIEKAADKISELADKFNKLTPAQKDNVVKFAALAAAAGPLIGITGKLMDGFGKFTEIMGKLGIKGMLIAGAVAGAIWLWKNWDKVSEWIGKKWKALGEWWDKLRAKLREKAQAKVEAITERFHTRIQKVKDWWSDLRKSFNEWVKGKVDAVTTSFTSKVDAVRELWSSTKQLMADVVKGVFEAVTGAFHTAVDTVREKWQGLKEFFSAPITGTVNIVRNAWDGAKSKVKEWTGPSAATGMNRIPYDGFIVETHKDEMILTAKASEQYRAMGGTKDGIYTRGISAQSGASSTTTTTNNSPNVVINVSGGSNPQATAQAVRREMDNYFKMLNYQGI